ncbi:hypothetical protein HDU87_007327 [Geranomyces variabilis]|uniref:Uncharacterized protein n=1 Tax=Geranomyces variabilis TaxID=109894 RepID=A0AAD5TGC5_9FUNG|nr:hypothetical protein HDU87_007327 [Geranomyces variabilis]
MEPIPHGSAREAPAPNPSQPSRPAPDIIIKPPSPMKGSSSSSTLSSLCSSKTNNSSLSLSSTASFSTPSEGGAETTDSSSRSSISSYTSSSPSVSGGSKTPVATLAVTSNLSADRRRLARERLRSAMAAVSPGRRGETKSPSAVTASKTPERKVNSKIPEAAEPSPPALSIAERRRSIQDDDDALSSQLGRLSMIAAASGWDIKLRELVMKEAKEGGDPSTSSLITPTPSPRRSMEDPPKSASHSAVDVDARPSSAEEPGKLAQQRRRSTIQSYQHLSRFSASAPNVMRTRSVVIQDPSVIASKQKVVEGLGVSSETLVDEETDGPEPTGARTDTVREVRSRRRTSEYSTIVGAYDERLREIVMEAAGGLQTRLRGRKSVGEGDSPNVDENAGRPPLRRANTAVDLTRRRTLSVTTANAMRRSAQHDDRDDYEPSTRVRTAPSTPARKAQSARRQTFHEKRSAAPHRGDDSAALPRLDASPFSSDSDGNAVNPSAFAAGRHRLVGTPPVMSPSLSYVHTLQDIPASPISPVAGMAELPLPSLPTSDCVSAGGDAATIGVPPDPSPAVFDKPVVTTPLVSGRTEKSRASAAPEHSNNASSRATSPAVAATSYIDYL